jgi:hypothetical protein
MNTPFFQLKYMKQEMIPKIKWLQCNPDKLTCDPITQDEASKQKFIDLPSNDLFYIHPPSIDREYTFIKTQSDMDQHKEFGIYMVSSTLTDDDIEYEYSDPPPPFSQKNNILSDQVSPSLKKYTDRIKEIMRIPPNGTIQVISLQDLLYCLFTIVQWDSIHIIDIGCRQMCQAYASQPDIKATFEKLLHVESTRLGKKQKSKRNHRTKKSNTKKI